MSIEQSLFGSARRYHLFTAVKYLVYALLCLNVLFFLQEELASLEYTFAGKLTAGEVVQVFAATIDTAAWVVLLLLFELETSVLDDSRLRGSTRWIIHGVRLLCSVAIVYAFTGYCAELLFLYDTAPSAVSDPCELAGQGYSLLLGLDDYAPLGEDNCAALGAGALRVGGLDILAAPTVLESARWLAWTDVINAGAWILVVVVLEIEVRLQLRGALSDHILRINLLLKYAVYATLFAAAAYWGWAGDFIDVWDACLWLFAFIFIELNVFEWQRESRAAEPLAA